jgi:hypothetical protein
VCSLGFRGLSFIGYRYPPCFLETYVPVRQDDACAGRAPTALGRRLHGAGPPRRCPTLWPMPRATASPCRPGEGDKPREALPGQRCENASFPLPATSSPAPYMAPGDRYRPPRGSTLDRYRPRRGVDPRRSASGGGAARGSARRHLRDARRSAARDTGFRFTYFLVTQRMASQMVSPIIILPARTLW